MGLQVSHCIHTEATQEESVWCTAAASWGDFSRVSLTQGVKNCGSAHHGRSRSYVFEQPAEVRGFKCGGVFKREECDPDCAEVWRATEELYRRHFWARGYFVSTVGLDENIVRAYIRNQEEEEMEVEGTPVMSGEEEGEKVEASSELAKAKEGTGGMARK